MVSVLDVNPDINTCRSRDQIPQGKKDSMEDLITYHPVFISLYFFQKCYLSLDFKKTTGVFVFSVIVDWLM